MNRRLLYILLHIDTNLINARQKLPAVNQIEKWCKDGVILINISNTAYGEALKGNNVQRTRKANKQIYTVTPPIGSSDPLYTKVETALFPKGARNEKQRNDVRIVCDAAKYNAILVTGDYRHILRNRDKLRDIVQILSPDEAVAFVRKKITERDKFNERVAKEFGGKLPPWSGKD